MKAILVIATDAKACKTITECLRAEYKVEVHPNKESRTRCPAPEAVRVHPHRRFSCCGTVGR